MAFRLAIAVLSFLVLMAETGLGSAVYRRPQLSSRSRIAAGRSHHAAPHIDYKTLYFRQPVDHFGYANQDTYLQRYLVVDKYWKGEDGPIFFYTGNEGDIVWFLENTGLMFDWTPEFKAMIVFAEHRYYGESMPYGADSYKDLKHLGYLSAEQALADFAVLIDHIKSNVSGARHSPVVAFGGSYGGMLTAWFRMKYPHSIVGALAASAPIWLFGDLVPCDKYFQIITADFQQSGPNCAENIRRSWKVITQMSQTDSGRHILTRAFHLCQPLNATSGGQEVKDWLSNTWSSLAMVDYPYPASFLEPLPAWPIKAVCEHLKEPNLTDDQLIEHLHDAVNVYYNYTGTTPCFNTSQQAVASLGDFGWDFQACSEMVMPMCSTGVKDMFEESAWDLDAFTKACQKKWGVTPRPNWILEQFGGKNISTASNIIFSNGQLDPWRAGGVTSSLSETLVAVLIQDGAHHLDLRSSNPLDPTSVTKARDLEKETVRKWIEQSYSGDETPKAGCAVDKLVIINALPNGYAENGNRSHSSAMDFMSRASFQQNFLVFLILSLLFVGVIILVGFSGRRHATNYRVFAAHSDSSPLI